MYSKKTISQLLGVVVKAEIPELKLAHDIVGHIAVDGGDSAIELYKIMNFAPEAKNDEERVVLAYLKTAYDNYFVE